MLRNATTRDLPAVASWVSSAHECELWAGPRVQFPIDIRALPGQIDFRESDTFCLVEHESVIAFGQLITKSFGRGHLARLIVAPAFRGQGYGESLVKALLVRARDRALERASLNVNDLNARAIALYEKLGFRDAECPFDEPPTPGVRYLERPVPAS
jgi:ribosomal protein S18 acetylase RimI-like enzyme